MRGRFRIVDRVCLDLLCALRDAFAEEGLPFALAGGMGVQALMAAAGLEHLLRLTSGVRLDEDLLEGLLAARRGRFDVLLAIRARLGQG